MRDPAEVDCPNAYECFNGNQYGKGCYEDLLQNAMGGKPWHECHCMTDEEREELKMDKYDEKRLAKIEKELEELRKDITELKDLVRDIRQPTKFGPWDPPKRDDPWVPQPTQWPTLPPNPGETGIKFCPKCGIEMKGVMGYVCNRMDCPTGLGPVICSSTGNV